MINLKSIESDNNYEQEPDNDIIEYPEEKKIYNDYNYDYDYDDMPDEEEDERFSIELRKKRLLMSFYLIEFPKKLSIYKKINLEDLSSDELDKLKEEWDFIIGAKNSVGMSVTAFRQAIFMLEEVCVKYTPLQVQGMRALGNDQDLIDVKHFALQNMTLIKTFAVTIT